MSLPRTMSTIPASLLRLAAPSAARKCPQCLRLRTFSSYTPYNASSKRQLQTASAYHPSSLNPEIPPRNFNVPETSIAGGSPLSRSGIPPRLPTEESQKRGTVADKEASPAGMSESEAQQSAPVPQYASTSTSSSTASASTSSASAKTSRPLRRYNFGPKKAVIKLSPSAVSHLRDLLNQPTPQLIRIGTKAKGCSGLAYHLEYVEKPSPLDEQVEQDGVKVLIDNKALLNIIGSEMDWLSDKLNERFVFRNPNITEQCGCGESFSVS